MSDLRPTTVTIIVTMHRPITDTDGEAALYAAVEALYDGDDNRDDRDDWSFTVTQQETPNV